ncbi:MAG: hemolysin family protein [Chloroflexi bacterium]|nr:hemolysin family protein [Chloroflexota bacterium]
MNAMGLPLLLVSMVSLSLLVFAVAADVAFSIVRDERLDRLVQRKVPGARRLATMQGSHESVGMAIVILRGGTTAIFAISALGMAINLAPSTIIGFFLGLLIALGGTVFAQGAGRVWGRLEPEKVAVALVPMGIATHLVLRPIARGLIGLHLPLARRLTRRRPAANGSSATTGDPAEASIGEEGDAIREGDHVDDWERRVSRGIFNLESKAVREIMVPRPDIVGIPVDATLDDAVDTVLRAGFSRIPLFRDTIDHVIGILYAKDLLGALRGDHAADMSLETIARPAYLIPETKRLGDLLHDFQERRVHIALVVDEYGSLVGLVTHEDLLEELVGEIEDEFTVRDQLVDRLSPDEAIVDARAPLRVVNELFDVDLGAEGFDTLGGLIYHKLGRVPTTGDSVSEDGVGITVLSTAGRRVRRVRVSRGGSPDKPVGGAVQSE